MRFKYRISLAVIAILLVVSLMVGTSYALWKVSDSQEGMNELAVGCFQISFLEESKSIRLENSYPMSDDKGLETTPYTFTITNICSHGADYHVLLNTFTTNTMPISKVKYAISETQPTYGTNLEVRAKEYRNSMVDVNLENLSDSIILTNGFLDVGESKTFHLYLWIDSLASNEVMNTRFEANVMVVSSATSTLAGVDGYSSDGLTISKINEIRSTPNTDVSGRSGKVYYVSSLGNDSNDGLSLENAWASLDKINSAFTSKIIQDGDTILLRRGDVFRGHLEIKNYNILIGSYGEESKPKPEILVSPYDGTKTGVWELVEENIWRYTVDGADPFLNDVGVVWFFCKPGNTNCSHSLTNNSHTFSYGQKRYTMNDVEESFSTVRSLLTNDLDFYHMGHAYSNHATGGALYVYSKENPQERFDEIEFSLGVNGIRVGTYTDFWLDNVTIKFAGNHGVGSGSIANLKVTNSEFGFIGGAMQHFNNGPVRFGNAVEVYGNVLSVNGYPVKDGLVASHNYVYQVYDAGLTFQYTSATNAVMELTTFSDNVLEYCNYNIEYWVKTNSTDVTHQENTYIKNYYIKNNILRYSGYGISETRPDKTQSAHIKSWGWENYKNILKGEYLIENNIFDTSNENILSIHAGNDASLPTLVHNTFNQLQNRCLGFYYGSNNGSCILYQKDNLNAFFPNNTFYYK